MYNTAKRIVKDAAEAEDVMQEAFITAFNKLDHFKGDASFGAWLKRIVINKSIEQYRKSSRYVPLSEETYTDGPIEEESSTIEYAQLKAHQILDCMNQLHDNYRNVLNLHLIEGYDYEEMCSILNISYANCRTLVSRAKESLRTKLVVHS